MKNKEALCVLKEAQDILAPLLQVGFIQRKLQTIACEQHFELMRDLLSCLSWASLQYLVDELLEHVLVSQIGRISNS